MAKGAGEVEGRRKILDTRHKILDFRQKIKDKRKEFIEQDAFDFRTEYYQLSIINYPFQLFVIHQLLLIHNFFFLAK